MSRKSDRTRNRILQAANRLFYRKGFNRTSFTDVVDAADVPRGNIYYYFKTKEDILHAAVEYRLEVIHAMLDEWNRKFADPADRLKRFLQVLANSRSAMAQWGCPMGTLNTELGKDQPDLHADARRMFEAFEHWMTAQFAALGRDDDAAALARRLLAWGQGLAVMAHVHNDPEFLAREAAALEAWIDSLDRREP
jgi:AcrR family transcriptional regulator